MKKLTLDCDALRVEGFTTSEVPEPRGTVQANATGATCITKVTCGNTCHCTSVDIGCWCTEAC